MNHELREQLQINLLNQANAASQFGLTDSAYRQGARTQGFMVELEDVKREIDYLVEAGFLKPVEKAISPVLRKHRLTKEGRDWLDIHG